MSRVEDFRYRQVAQAIRDAITAGELRPGDPVPSAKTLSQEHDVSVETARKSLRLVASEGLIVRVSPGLPFYVK